MSQEAWIAVVLFLLAYALIISEKIHRTIVSMLGAGIILLVGILDEGAAVKVIDFNTLGLLIGMMVIVSIIAETGFFRYLAIMAAKKAQGEPVKILIALSLITAIASAFLDNVTTVLLIVPVTFSISRRLNVSPFPFLMTEIFSSNIGGTATLIGDPPNLMIGGANRSLSFIAFINNLAPVVAVILVLTIFILILFWKGGLKANASLCKSILELNALDEITDSRLLKKSLIVLALTIGGFFMHQIIDTETAVIALTGAFLLLLISGEKYLERSLAGVEWSTIFFFIGLFILVGGLVKTGVIADLASGAMAITKGNPFYSSILILWFSSIASAFVDNIPLVAAMIPLIKEMGRLGLQDLNPMWWSLSLGACLGGNGTLIGASANVVVSGLAAKEGYRISFARFLLYGIPIMVLSMVVSTIYVWLRYFL